MRPNSLRAYLCCALICSTLTAAAQTYPDKPIRAIVPFAAGGGVDIATRSVGQKLTERWHQQVIVDNRGGAAGVIGTRAAAKTAPDGYTLVMSTSGTTTINPSLHANPGYAPLKDFVPIGLVAETPIVLMAHPSFPPRTVAELIAYAKTNKLDAGTPPPGTENYLAAELFKSATGIDMTIVSYKGTGPLTNDLVGGHIPLAFNTLPPALGNLQAGTLRAIAVAGRTRSSQLPDVPTVAESGLPGFEAVVRYGLLAPAGTPTGTVTRLNRELRAAVELARELRLVAGEGS